MGRRLLLFQRTRIEYVAKQLFVVDWANHHHLVEDRVNIIISSNHTNSHLLKKNKPIG
jgi:hypothetical protein